MNFYENRGQPGLNSVFQDCQIYIVRSCINKTKRTVPCIPKFLCFHVTSFHQLLRICSFQEISYICRIYFFHNDLLGLQNDLKCSGFFFCFCLFVFFFCYLVSFINWGAAGDNGYSSKGPMFISQHVHDGLLLSITLNKSLKK